MRILKIILPIGLTIIGTLGLVVGELDDAPGAGGIGLILIGISIYLNYKNIKN